MAYLHGKFVWFEHVSSEVEKARAFYGALFGWGTDPIPVGDSQYHLIQNGAEGIGGFRAAMPGMPNHWLSYLSVADVDESARAVVASGGRVLMPPTDFAPVGRGAAIADPGGAALSVWKATEGDRPDTGSVVPGDWHWNECWCADPAAACTFYEKTFGYTHDSMDMGPQGTYYVLMKDGVPRGGLTRLPQPGVPAAWLPYVAVADCDATAAKAAGLGAKISVPATEVPGVGRFAILADPVGAAIGIIRSDR